MVLLGVYLILAGLSSLNVLSQLGQITAVIGLVAGILLLTEHWRR
jgi:hypothetical protein